MSGAALLRLAILLLLALLALAAWIDALLFLRSPPQRRSKPLYLDHVDDDANEPRAA